MSNTSFTTRMFGKPHLYNVIYEQCVRSLASHNQMVLARAEVYKRLEEELVPVVLRLAREIDR